MVKFQGGPADGVILRLHRAPLMLRVVYNRLSKAWDALNELDDTPKDHEEIHVYRITAPPQRCHIRTSKRSTSGMYTIATYAHYPNQPGDAHTRTNAAWSAWCEANKDELDKGFRISGNPE